MKSYLGLAPKYLSAHKSRSRLAMISVIIAVALVVGIISLLDALVIFERQNILKTEGNYHILLRNPSKDEIKQLQSRFDVLSSGLLKEFNNGIIAQDECAIGAIDSDFAPNLNFNLKEGSYPEAVNEIMLEQWYMTKAGLKLGNRVSLTSSTGATKDYIISGIYQDWGETKATDIPIVFLSMKASASMTPEKSSYFLLFKEGININNAEKSIKAALNISDSRIARNEHLLALMLQTQDNRILQFYVIGFGLFALVLVTAVVMIYNTFNISVMERVRHFGILRCIGSSRKQIKRLVRREGLVIAAKSIPMGVGVGFLMSVACLMVLHLFNQELYGTIHLLYISPLGITAGILLGFLTVLLALLSPAKKASRVSPVSALVGSSEIKLRRKKKAGLLSKLLPIEIVMGIQNACGRKKTLFLMTSSIAFSIILFLLFQSLINPDVLGTRPIQAYTADVRVTSKDGIDEGIYQKLQELAGVNRMFGRMSTTIKASVKENRLTDNYKSKLGKEVETDADGYLVNPEKSWLISYDNTQLRWARTYLTKGTAKEDDLNNQNGVIVVNKIYRDHILMKTTDFDLGDKVKLSTKKGVKEFTIVGITDSIPYSTDDITMTTFITTEKIYQEITGEASYHTLDIQLTKGNQDVTVEKIKSIAGASLKVGDRRQMNERSNNAYMTVSVFLYGFVAVIGFISILNIVNTMNTSIVARMKRYGVMRAVGLSGSQLNRMVITESSTFCLLGCVVGCVIGLTLRKGFTDFMLIQWSFPVMPVLLIVLTCLLASTLSVLRPLKLIKEKGISDVINTL